MQVVVRYSQLVGEYSVHFESVGPVELRFVAEVVGNSFVH